VYLNRASYGNKIAVSTRASRAYFGRSSHLLTTAQAAFLARASAASVRASDPYRSPNDAIARQHSVAAADGDARVISPEQLKESLDERLALVRDRHIAVSPRLSFVEMALAASGGQARWCRRRSTAILQRDVVGIIRAQRDLLTPEPARRRLQRRAFVVARQPQTSEWVAWEGSGRLFRQRAWRGNKRGWLALVVSPARR
jgi:membrane carboxypeptidase/penicillin-binding protein PbpC